MKASNHEMFIKQRQKQLFDEIRKLNIVKKQNQLYAESKEQAAELEVNSVEEPKPVPEEIVEEPVKEVTVTEASKKKKGRKKKSEDAKK